MQLIVQLNMIASNYRWQIIQVDFRFIAVDEAEVKACLE